MMDLMDAMAARPGETSGGPVWLSWVSAARSGDAEAFGELVRTFWPDQLYLQIQRHDKTPGATS